MSSGPEHYQEAERLLGKAIDGAGKSYTWDAIRSAIDTAQVHATLALAAATAMNGDLGKKTHQDREKVSDQWTEVLQ